MCCAASAWVASIVNIFQAGFFEQNISDGFFPIFRASRQGLKDENIIITVYNQTGDAVRLSIDQTNCICILVS